MQVSSLALVGLVIGAVAVLLSALAVNELFPGASDGDVLLAGGAVAAALGAVFLFDR